MSVPVLLPISAVERETGLGKDTLRVWERRYGFPSPVRNASGERAYPADQVERLRVIRRLMDQGYRPGRLMGSGLDELQQLVGAESRDARQGGVAGEDVGRFLLRLRAHDVTGLRQAFQESLIRQGLQRFILDTVVPLNRGIGEAWMRGELNVFEEHLYSEQLKTTLRQAAGSLPEAPETAVRILLTTIPGEEHDLGLLMAECLFRLNGAFCIALGAQTPLNDIAMATVAHRAEVLALPFSSAFPQRRILAVLRQCRALLPEPVEIWAGGAGVSRIQPVRGILVLPGLEQALDILHSRNQGWIGNAGK